MEVFLKLRLMKGRRMRLLHARGGVSLSALTNGTSNIIALIGVCQGGFLFLIQSAGIHFRNIFRCQNVIQHFFRNDNRSGRSLFLQFVCVCISQIAVLNCSASYKLRHSVATSVQAMFNNTAVKDNSVFFMCGSVCEIS